jgi:hypothetical protein
VLFEMLTGERAFAREKEIGDLAKVRRVVKVLGMVNAAPDFADHPKVITRPARALGRRHGLVAFRDQRRDRDDRGGGGLSLPGSEVRFMDPALGSASRLYAATRPERPDG